MKITTYTKYGHRILNVDDPVAFATDITGLHDLIRTTFESGFLHMAVRFTSDSFLSSRTLALLIESSEKATSIGGTFTVISPNTQIVEVLKVFELESSLRTVATEKGLLDNPFTVVI